MSRKISAPVIAFTLVVFGLSSGDLWSQQFVNGDLDGVITGTPSQLATSWTFVPFGDPTCEATWSGGDTPDLTSIDTPNLPGGIAGIPFSGMTFMSGLKDLTMHEGIMQDLTGLTIGELYSITFYQSVVKQIGGLDTTGAWVIYADNVLIDTSSFSTSHLAYDDINLIWEKREIIFMATDSVHLIKFLPLDDENLLTDAYDEAGLLRMGIDSIALSVYNCENSFDLSVIQDGVILTVNNTECLYQWLDCNSGNVLLSGETNQVFTAQSNGSYAAIVSSEYCIDTSDCIEISEVSLSHNNQEQIISIYPNPVDESARINFSPLMPNEYFIIKIYDLIGNIVLTSEVLDEPDYMIPTDLLISGFYFVQLTCHSSGAQIGVCKLTVN